MLKTTIDNTVSSFGSKIAENETKNKSIENEFKKLKTVDLSYFIDKNYFEEDGSQNYLVFQPISRYFKMNGKHISSWKSKGLSDETITPYVTSDNSLTPLTDHYGTNVEVKFNGSCLKQSNKLTYDYGHRENVYIVFELDASGSNDNDPTLKNYLFGSGNLTKNTNIEKGLEHMLTAEKIYSINFTVTNTVKLALQWGI